MTRLLTALLVAAALSTSAIAAPKMPVCNPPLPYSCTTVRLAVKAFSRAYLEREGKKRGLTPCMKRQAEACVAGAP